MTDLLFRCVNYCLPNAQKFGGIGGDLLTNNNAKARTHGK